MIRLYIFALAMGAVFLLGGGCSSDPPSPLGSEFIDNGLIHPDSIEVVQDTVLIAGDTTFVVSDFLFNSNSLELGRRDSIEAWPVLRIDFSNPGADTLRTVRSASLFLTYVGVNASVGARFVNLAAPLAESDTLVSISLGDPIPDSTLIDFDRTMQPFPRSYTLPPALVQAWIRGEQAHNGIAVVLEDPIDTAFVSLGSSENADPGSQPFLRVTFTAGEDSRYTVSDDGTFVQDLFPALGLLLADGGARRVYLPIDVGVFDPNTLIHDAKLILHVVPGSFIGQDFVLSVYSPSTDDIEDPRIRSGTVVNTLTLQPDSTRLVVSVKNILSNLIAGELEKPPLIIRYTAEGTAIRRVAFFSSSAPNGLKPELAFTYSTAPRFPR